jgi:predicted DNA-binding transcriptional regulator AlpA
MVKKRAPNAIPVSTTNDRLLSLAEAALRLRMGESTLRQKLYDGIGPVAIKLPGSDRWRFRQSDLDAYVGAAAVSPVATN